MIRGVALRPVLCGCLPGVYQLGGHRRTCQVRLRKPAYERSRARIGGPASLCLFAPARTSPQELLEPSIALVGCSMGCWTVLPALSC